MTEFEDFMSEQKFHSPESAENIYPPEELIEPDRKEYNADEIKRIIKAATELALDFRGCGDRLTGMETNLLDDLWGALQLCPECENVRLDDARVTGGMKCGRCAYGGN